VTLIAALVDSEEPKIYNYALLDLAKKICLKVQEPSCERCPVRQYCLYGISQGALENQQVITDLVAESAARNGE
jgi:adenine-specific DNA glycosylase